MKIFLCRYGSSSAVISAAGIADARTAFVEDTDFGKNYLSGINRKGIQCNEVRGVALTEPMATTAENDGLARVLRTTRD